MEVKRVRSSKEWTPITLEITFETYKELKEETDALGKQAFLSALYIEMADCLQEYNGHLGDET